MFALVKQWDSKSLAMWKLERQKGLLRYSLEVGVLKWGLWMFVIFVIFQIISFELSGIGSIVRILWTNGLIWGVAGWLYGNLIFYFTDKEYIKTLENKREYASRE